MPFQGTLYECHRLDYYLNITYRICCWFLWFVHFRLLLKRNSKNVHRFICVFLHALLARLWSCLLKVCLVWCAESLMRKNGKILILIFQNKFLFQFSLGIYLETLYCVTKWKLWGVILKWFYRYDKFSFKPIFGNS